MTDSEYLKAHDAGLARSAMTTEEEIARAFDYGAKQVFDWRSELFPLPPENWPAEAKQAFYDGQDFARSIQEFRWGRYATA